MTDDRTLTVMVRKLDGKADADRVRADVVKCFLQWVVHRLQQHLDPAKQRNIGLPEAEAFLEALVNGGTHPLLEEWKQNKSANRPAPSKYELQARRYVLLLVTALERAGFGKDAAHRYAARELGRVDLFSKTPTAGAIAHWQERMAPLEPAEEQQLATAIAVCGLDPRRLTQFFLGPIHVALNPTAHVVDEHTL
jgi:hypothetical protein